MKPQNLISVINANKLFIENINENQEYISEFKLKEIEIKTLEKLKILLLNSKNFEFKILDNYYIGYTIPNISKEFDLLRIDENTIINIELKSIENLEKIKNQSNKNYYYLKGIKENIFIFTYVEENNNIYFFDKDKNDITIIHADFLLEKILKQDTQYNINIDDLFKVKNYLISPFNNPERFINDEYFLTDHQENIKKDILNLFEKNNNNYICITGNAGTGKTLLTYDIAKTLSTLHKFTLIVHCGILNKGHQKIKNIIEDKESDMRICSIKELKSDPKRMELFDVVIFDEAQRMKTIYDIQNMLDKPKNLIFSYDVNQFLKENESLDISEALKSLNKEVKEYKLTNKIRTNEQMASFIKNLFKIGSCKKQLTYNDVSIECFNDTYVLDTYIKYLESENWKFINYSTSIHTIESISYLKSLSEITAHKVLGQEFKKVVLVMDSNFKYDTKDELTFKKTYYSLHGMLYQIVTRVVDELKIIVLNNDDLYFKLLKIKNKDF